jgi:hypothetical protein
MTEAEWLACEDSEVMLLFLHTERQKLEGWKSRLLRWQRKKRVSTSDRKMQRLLLAYYYRHADLLNVHCKYVFDLAESYAEGDATYQELEEASSLCLGCVKCDEQRCSLGYFVGRACLQPQSKFSIYAQSYAGDALDTLVRASYIAQLDNDGYGSSGAKEQNVQVYDSSEKKVVADLLREVIGNPYNRITLNSTWLTSTVVALAMQMYESRDFSAMPILADALQDAGCDTEDVLNHCRDPKATHVLGCWVVDLVLGKG